MVPCRAAPPKKRGVLLHPWRECLFSLLTETRVATQLELGYCLFLGIIGPVVPGCIVPVLVGESDCVGWIPTR